MTRAQFQLRVVVLAVLGVLGHLDAENGAKASQPPGPGPFGSEVMTQPVVGAERGVEPDGWRRGKLCDVSREPYLAVNQSNATEALRRAIDDCGDLNSGGTVLIPRGFLLRTASLWLRSNLTLRIEAGATLLSTATGDMKTPASTGDAPMVYTRRNDIMMMAHAGLINAGRCIKMKQPIVGWDDCAEWTSLENVVIEGGGTLDADGEEWYDSYLAHGNDGNTRPMMLDLLWVNGLTVRNMRIRRPGFWTVHPTFSNNVRITGNSIVTTGDNTDGCDPDSSWNIYIAQNTFSTGDDCIAIKAGRDWSGRMVNISTQNVLVERNVFQKGHGVSIGSETSGWIRNVTIRDSLVDGTNLAVRIKSCRGRGGGVEDVVYENLHGHAQSGVQLTLNYKSGLAPTNVTATPTFRRITVRNINIQVDNSALDCAGLDDSPITGITFENVTITGKGAHSQTCSRCTISARNSHPHPEC